MFCSKQTRREKHQFLLLRWVLNNYLVLRFKTSYETFVILENLTSVLLMPRVQSEDMFIWNKAKSKMDFGFNIVEEDSLTNLVYHQANELYSHEHN